MPKHHRAAEPDFDALTVVVHSVEGHVAEFCPFCRAVSRHELVRWARARARRVGFPPFSIWVPVDKGRPFRHDIICCVCRAERTATRQKYVGVRSHTRDIHELITSTNPGLPQEFADRFELERRLTQAKLTDEERRHLLEVAMRDVQLLVARQTSLHDPEARRTLWLSIVRASGLAGGILLVGAALDGLELVKDPWPLTFIAVGCVILGLVALLFWQYWNRERRFYRLVVAPLLVRALAPLNPDVDELGEVMASRKRSRLTERLNAAALHEAIASVERAPD